ncbi:AAA family ATPase [Streptomyces sp. NPDC048279]|uniref:AAA family ATPase n=1 Tax=Streptomyces sp. NPDC048279 TaxID=3154714 RepID=UPI0034206147
MTGGAGNLANQLNAARDRAFVGRLDELKRFWSALDRMPGTGSVFYVHGPGGVGKSTLLRRFAAEARDAGRVVVVQVDGRLIDPSPAGFRAEVAEVGRAGTPGGCVLIVDAFEHCQGLEGWLRERYLPRLPENTVVVIAGRQPPSMGWLCDLAWSDALNVLPLGPLDPEAAATFLDRRGVARSVRDSVLAFAGGHPLALSLAASVAIADTHEAASWEPKPDVIAALLAALVGDLPSRTHRLALETAAHVLTTTESLLAAMIGEEQSDSMFAWLRGLPFCEYGRNGLYLHDLVREILDRDFRWRDPHGYEHMHRRTGHYLLNRVRVASEPDMMTAVRALTYLKRYGGMAPYFQTMEREGDVYDEVLRPDDHEAVIRMAAEAEGEESAQIVRFWLQENPQDFWLYRNAQTGTPVAFMAWLRLSRPYVGAAVDPVVAAAWEHVSQVDPLRPGEHMLLCRFLVCPEAYAEVSTAGHLMQLRICGDWIRSSGLSWSFIASPHAEAWTPLMDHLGHRKIYQRPWLGGRILGLFACDWRVTPLEIWFDRTQPGHLSEPKTPLGAGHGDRKPLSRTEFDKSVRDALRSLYRPEALRANPLLSGHLMAVHGGSEDPAEALRRVLTDTVETLLDDPRGGKLHRAVETTYLRKVPTQEAAAERLRLPYSTYRRHLSQGIDRVCELLWHLETSLGKGAAPDLD